MKMKTRKKWKSAAQTPNLKMVSLKEAELFNFRKENVVLVCSRSPYRKKYS